MEAELSSVERAAEELYGLDPAQFTASRDERVRLLDAAGDTSGAAAVKALKKPSMAAWAVNQLVREDRVQVDALLAIGGELRQAQRDLSGDDLRALTGQRHRVVRAVASRAAEIAEAAGHPLSPAAVDQVARSLDAALTDPSAAETLLAGRLVSDLTYAGLGEPDLTFAAGLTVVPSGTTTDVEPSAKAARRKALAAAERSADEAEAAFAAAEESLARAREAADAANLRAASAEETVEAARVELEAAKDAEAVSERALALADKAHDRAGARLADARSRLEDLRR